MNIVEKEEDQMWKKRIQKIYPSIEELDIIYTDDYKYLYSDNSFNDPDSCGLNYGDYDYSDYPDENVWYWEKWW